MATSTELSNNILNALEILTNASVDAAKFDKTITGIIVSCVDEATGKYRVKYQDAIWIAYSSNVDVKYSNGTSVQVKIPNNDFNERKMIIGTAQEGGIEYGTVVEDPLLRYDYVGVNCATFGKEYNLSSYWDSSKNSKTIYNVDNGTNEIGLDAAMVAQGISESDSVILGATIRTNLPDEQRYKGNYGIKYTLRFKDASGIEDNIIERDYIVDIDKMSGDPYGLGEDTDQWIPFDIDRHNFIEIKSIELFADGFPEQNNDAVADIFIKNVLFQCANRIPDEQFDNTGLTIITPEGNYFDDPDDEKKPATVEIRVRGKSIDDSKTGYYWFIEDLRVMQANDTGYHKCGGRGWRILNPGVVTEEDDNGKAIKIDYPSAKATIDILQSNSRAYETKYKCVVIYNGTTLSKEFSFINYSVKSKIEITSSEGVNFVDSIGKTNLICNYTDESVVASSYVWAKVDNTGSMSAIPATADRYNQLQTARRNFVDYQNKINNGTIPINDNTLAILDGYKQTLETFDNLQIVYENGIYNLLASTIYDYNIYKCAAFDASNNLLGIATIRLTNKLKQGEDEQTGQLVINNGGQVFKYNAKGIAPTSDLNEVPQVIQPLSFTLYTSDGIEIPAAAIRNDDCSWYVPSTNTLINITGTPDSLDQDTETYLYSGKTLSYTISEKYVNSKDRNEIELRVWYQNQLYIAKTNFYFIKDGENGTNGTKYVVKIVPHDGLGRLKVVGPGETGTDWLDVELWEDGSLIQRTNCTVTTPAGRQVGVAWSMLKVNASSKNNISVTNHGNQAPSWAAVASSGMSTAAIDIVKAVVTYDGNTITATAPIVYDKNKNSNYRIYLKKGTGFTHVTYSDDGLTPDYDSNSPFELVVEAKDDNGNWGDISTRSSLNFSWSFEGNLTPNSTDDEITYSAKPDNKYNDIILNNAVTCLVRNNTTTIGNLHIPIHFLLNTYGHSAINEWDGNSVQLDADGNTMLLAPQAGFGKKDSTTNTYTGVLLGTVKDYVKNKSKEGIFGYNKGIRTYFLNAANGSAIFGKSGNAGQIIIDPDNNRALLYSADFWKAYNENTDLPSSYNSTNESGKGALIDLTTPSIRWGNKKFSVDDNGILKAVDGEFSGKVVTGNGRAGGWIIDTHSLYSNITNSNGRITLDSGYSEDSSGNASWDGGKIYSHSHNTLTNTGTGFYLSKDGLSIGSKFKVTNTGILTLGTDAVNGTRAHWTIDGSDAASYIAYGKHGENNSVYIGTDEISLGADTDYQGVTNTTSEDTHGTFEVTNQGVLYAKNVFLKGRITATSGYIGNGVSGWTIANTAIYNNKTGISTKPTGDSDTSGVYIGTTGIGIGALNDYKAITGKTSTDNHSMFEVTNKGILYAKGGYFDGKINAATGKIGGWTIGTNTLSSGSGDTYVALDSGASGVNYAIWAGKASAGSAPFSVTRAGALVATSAKIKGNIEADSGTLGNGTNKITIGKSSTSSSNSAIYYGDKNGLSVNKTGFYLGTDGLSLGTTIDYKDITGTTAADTHSKFEVTSAGKLYAKGAVISGAITAESGKIGDITITSDGKLIIPAGNTTGTFAAIQIPNLDASKITSGRISTTYLDSSIITTSNFSAQNINADKINSGHISADYLSGGTINANDINVTNINGINVKTGTIGTTQLADGSVTNAKIGNLSADKITTGTLTGRTINCGNSYIQGDGNSFQFTNNTAWFSMNVVTTHPWASALNLASGSTVGIRFYNGSVSSYENSSKGAIYAYDNNLRLTAPNQVWLDGALRVSNSGGVQVYHNGTNYQLWLGDCIVHQKGEFNLWSGGSGTYVKANGSAIGSASSTLNVKENIKEKNIDNIPNILRNIKLYDYNYVKDFYEGKKDYGYIIDYLEKIPGMNDYLEYIEDNRNEKYPTKRLDQEHLIKFLLGSVIELQKQIDEIKGE